MQKSSELLGRCEVQDYCTRRGMISQNRLQRLEEGNLILDLKISFLKFQ
jgi:hypothetical protein